VSRLLTVPQAAAELGFCRRTVERWIAAGRLRAVRIGPGHPWRVPVEAIDAFIAGLDSNEPTYRPLRAAR
jgi:excisionase family DNA binding protein